MSIRVFPYFRSNSYATLDEATAILSARIWVDAWNDTSLAPSGRGYVLAAPASSGASSISVTGGVGDFLVGTTFTVGSDTTVYTVTSATTSPATTIAFTPTLAANAASGAAVFRLTPNDRERALITAAHVLDNYFEWNGSTTYQPSTQNMQWPRAGVADCEGYPVDHLTVPEFIKIAQSELAASLLERNLLSTPGLLGLGIDEASIPGPISVKISRTQRAQVVPDHVVVTMRCYGSLVNEARTGSRIVRTVRT